MTATITTDRAEYVVGDPIVMALEIENRTSAAVMFEFTSAQRYDFTISNESGDTVWRWSADMGFAQMLGSRQFDAGASKTYTERFDGHLPPGRYRVVGLLSATAPVSADTLFDVLP